MHIRQIKNEKSKIYKKNFRIYAKIFYIDDENNLFKKMNKNVNLQGKNIKFIKEKNKEIALYKFQKN